MNYDRAIEKRDYARIDKLNRLIDIETFWDDVRKFTKDIKSDHSIKRWQCLAEYRYEELSCIWSIFEKLNETDVVAFRCTESFYGGYKAERNDMFADRVEIHLKDEMFILYNDKIKSMWGDTFYRINDAKTLFCEGFVLRNSIIRAIDKGILEEVEDYKKPEVIVYSLEDVLLK